MGNLFGRTALVTGGARGLGRIYALRLANLGADVGVIDINLHSFRDFKEEAELLTADTVVEELKNKGVKAAGAEADIGNLNQVLSAVSAIVSELGDIDILVANAGGGFGHLNENNASIMDLNLYRKTMDRNLDGTVYTAMAVVPMMKKKGYGKIITVASIAGLYPCPEGAFAAYGTAKAAIIMYTKYLAQELGRYGINVNCIAPGRIMTGRMVGRMYKDAINGIALGRVGRPEDCAGVVEFLATDLSDYVTGTVIEVTGGFVGLA